MNRRFSNLFPVEKGSPAGGARRFTLLGVMAVVVFGWALAGRTHGQGVAMELGDVFDSQLRKAEIRESLCRSVSLQIQEVPLDELVPAMAKKLGYPVQLEITALEAIGVDPKTRLSVNIQDGSLAGCLRRTLAELDLTYIIRDDALLITSFEGAEANPAVEVYDISDFVDAQAKRLFASHAHRRSAESEIVLIEVIYGSIHPDAWDNVGGLGTIEVLMLGDSVSLIVTQTESVHEEIRSLLGVLRKHAAARQRKRMESEPQLESEKTRPSSEIESPSIRPADSQPTLKQVPDQSKMEPSPNDPVAANDTITRFIKLYIPEGMTAEEVVQWVRAMTPAAKWDQAGNLCREINDTMIVRHRIEVIGKVEHLLRDLELGLGRPYFSGPGGATGIGPHGFSFKSMTD